MAGAARAVGPQLVRQNEQNVWTAGHWGATGRRGFKATKSHEKTIHLVTRALVRIEKSLRVRRDRPERFVFGEHMVVTEGRRIGERLARDMLKPGSCGDVSGVVQRVDDMAAVVGEREAAM